MQKRTFRFGTGPVDYFFSGSLSKLSDVADRKSSVIITDANVLQAHGARFKSWKTIVIPAGEAHKNQATADNVIRQLIELEADRNTTIIGVGGGVVTDLAGYVASVYMRGVRCGFVPSSLLAMVDASVGGKNGIDVGAYKNMVGSIRQPAFLLYDASLLRTLPVTEWQNGFAEIIKHAAIKDAGMFRELAGKSPGSYMKSATALSALIQRNALLKTKVVMADPFEQGDRKLLNFGHTLGHAIENTYGLSHGQAIAVGMMFAARLSANEKGFKHSDKLESVLSQYGLPVAYAFDRDKIIGYLKMDKKRSQDGIQFILLEKIGKAVIQKIPISELYQQLQ